MNLATYTNTEIYKLAEPIWMNIITGSNKGYYDLFSASFSEDLKQKVTEERFHSQRNEFPLLISLAKDIEFIDCIRRESGITVLWRQKSSKLFDVTKSAASFEKASSEKARWSMDNGITILLWQSWRTGIDNLTSRSTRIPTPLRFMRPVSSNVLICSVSL